MTPFNMHETALGSLIRQAQGAFGFLYWWDGTEGPSLCRMAHAEGQTWLVGEVKGY